MSGLAQEQIPKLKAIPFLANYKNWVRWKLEPDKSGKLTKPPYIIGKEAKASTKKPTDWTDLQTALAHVNQLDTEAGIGFVFGGDAIRDEFVAFDLDGCVDPDTDEVTEWAERLIEKLDSYVEYTPSGKGLRIWVIGKYPGDEQKWNLNLSAGFGNKVEIQVFHKSGYVTVTGEAFYYDTPPTIQRRDLTETYEILKEIQSQYPAKIETADSISTTSTLTSTPRLSREYKPSAPLDALMNGTNSGSGTKPFVIYHEGQSYEFDSGSEADLRLCNLLARHYNEKDLQDEEKVSAEMDERFRESTLCQRDSKWETNASRRKHTIEKAIKNQADWLAAEDTERVSTVMKNGVYIQGPKKGQDIHGNIVTTTAKPNAIPINDYSVLLAPDELSKPRKSWIETNVPIPSEIPNEEQRYFVESMIMEHGIHLVSGAKGSLKTMFQLMLAKALCTGQDLLGRKYEGQPLTVIYVDRENPKAEMQKRMRALGLHDLRNFRIWGDWTIDNPPPISFRDPRFEEQLKRNPDTFFMFDSLSSFLEGGDENDTGEMLVIMQSARHLARNSAGLSVLHHVAKANKSQARGAGVIGDQTDMAFVMTKEGQNVVSLFDERFRGVESWKVKFEMDWGGLTGIYTPKLLSDSLTSKGVDDVSKHAHEAAEIERKRHELATAFEHQNQAANIIADAYDRTVKGKGECISSMRQLAQLIGLNANSPKVRALLSGGKDKPWNCVPGANNRIIYLPQGVTEVPKAPEKQPKKDAQNA